MKSPGLLKLTVSLTAENPQSFQFNSPQLIVIGRDATCDIVVDARGVSRQHCAIEARDDHWELIDLQSTNGVMLNGNLLRNSLKGEEPQSPILRNGDKLGLGTVTIAIEIQPWSRPIDPENATEIIEPPQIGKGSQSTAEQAVVRLPNENPMNRKKTVALSSPKPSGKSTKKSPSRREASNKSADHDGSATLEFTPTHANPLPRDFRNYRLLERVGAGGMGEVFLAIEREASERQLAIKLLKPENEMSPNDRARFVREMEITLNLKHPSLIQCVNCGEEAGQLYIVMEYCNGGNLAELLQRSGKLTLRRSVRLMDRLLAGVDHAHQMGIVHRDLKPSNVLLHRENGGKYLPKISDFGLAKSYLKAGDSGMTVNGSVGGSWAYMPKEQLTNFRYVSPQSDVWSLGAILYETMTMRLPRIFAPGEDPIRVILESKVVPIRDLLPDIHPALDNFMMKALAKEPEDRFKSAGSMRSALRKVAEIVGIEL